MDLGNVGAKPVSCGTVHVCPKAKVKGGTEDPRVWGHHPKARSLPHSLIPLSRSLRGSTDTEHECRIAALNAALRT